ncbi:hypothetical protein PGT21_005372 [Puccinia graminis f. sp. tritici]|uniref:Uncharacterized protein n=1 Tax=Puccinia graminis f. sp. tritici TaxID=56615 RepID=A0A5B0ML71_PUCGR|nr:hypothetical protein PGT21_005372 [Puccinia graminis f. sp. tritici]
MSVDLISINRHRPTSTRSRSSMEEYYESQTARESPRLRLVKKSSGNYPSESAPLLARTPDMSYRSPLPLSLWGGDRLPGVSFEYVPKYEDDPLEFAPFYDLARLTLTSRAKERLTFKKDCIEIIFVTFGDPSAERIAWMYIESRFCHCDRFHANSAIHWGKFYLPIPITLKIFTDQKQLKAPDWNILGVWTQMDTQKSFRLVEDSRDRRVDGRSNRSSFQPSCVSS